MSIYINKVNRVNIDEFIDINNRLNTLYTNIKNNVYTDYKLKIDQFNLEIGLNKDIIITNLNFHLNGNLHINNDFKECFICYDKICNNKIKTLLCNHYLCIDCYNKWNITCINNKIPTLCPFCRK
jgi:hypothetical protein